MEHESDDVFADIEPSRRGFVKKMVVGTAFAVPAVQTAKLTGAWGQTPTVSGPGVTVDPGDDVAPTTTVATTMATTTMATTLGTTTGRHDHVADHPLTIGHR